MRKWKGIESYQDARLISVWVESRERLRIEPGKRQKAIILNERVGPMLMMWWVDVMQGGGIVPAMGGKGRGI